MSTPLSSNDKQLADTVRVFGCPGIVPLSSTKAESPEQYLISIFSQSMFGRLPNCCRMLSRSFRAVL